MIKGLIIFDYDDTLVASSEYFYQLEIQVSQNLGLNQTSREFYFKLRGKPHEKMIEEMHPEIKLETYMKEYNRIYNPSNLVLFEGTLDVIKNLYNKGYKLAILSAKKIDKLEEHTKHLGIRSYFEYIHGAESSAYVKPDPRVFADILEKFSDIKKENIVYIGDQITDYLAASKAELKFIGIVSGIDNKDTFEKAGFYGTIQNINGLLTIF